MTQSAYLQDKSELRHNSLSTTAAQGKTSQRKGKVLEDHRGMSSPLQGHSNRTGLPDNLKSGMENLSGMNLDHVKVHHNSSKPATVQAHAYTQGSDIHLGPGQEKHLPHELGHVIQQAQGKVQPTTKVAGMPINDDAGLEAEADKLGTQAALQMRAIKAASLNTFATGSKPVVQRRTTFARQEEIRALVADILDSEDRISDARITGLARRATFFDADINVAAQQQLLREATELHNYFGNVFAANHQRGFSNYMGDGLDGVNCDTLRQGFDHWRQMRADYSPLKVTQRKDHLFGQVAIQAIRQNANDYNNHALRNANDLAAWNAALNQWQQHYFTYNRSRMIQFSAQNATGGGGPNARVWKSNQKLGGYDTHMTNYNDNVSANAGYYIAVGTDQAHFKDHIDAEVLRTNPNNWHNSVHFTIETDANTPKIYDNPPNAAHNGGILPVGVNWADFVAPFNACLTMVKNNMWNQASEKFNRRP